MPMGDTSSNPAWCRFSCPLPTSSPSHFLSHSALIYQLKHYATIIGLDSEQSAKHCWSMDYTDDIVTCYQHSTARDRKFSQQVDFFNKCSYWPSFSNIFWSFFWNVSYGLRKNNVSKRHPPNSCTLENVVLRSRSFLGCAPPEEFS